MTLKSAQWEGILLMKLGNFSLKYALLILYILSYNKEFK